MAISVRMFKEEDYAQIVKWWEWWKWQAVPLDHLPKIGAIVSFNDVDVCAGWLYQTDSKIALLEWVVSNPQAKQGRGECLSALIDELCVAAKSLGFDSVITIAKNAHLLKRLQDHGFTGEEKQMTNLVRIL
jgi:hypothetical protein